MGRWPREVIGGLVLAALAVAAFVPALGYGLGSLRQMRAGYFPAIVSATLVLLALFISATRWRERQDLEPVSLRPLVAITAAGIAFAALVRSFGLVPAIIATVLLSAMADRASTVAGASALAVAVAALSILIFTYALGLSLPLFRVP